MQHTPILHGTQFGLNLLRLARAVAEQHCAEEKKLTDLTVEAAVRNNAVEGPAESMS